MAHVAPIPREELADFESNFELVEQVMGFVPNSMFTMARVPGLLPAFQQLAGTVMMNGLIPVELVQMIAHVSSRAAGCRYCQAHTAHSAERAGVSEEKLAAIWSFETSDLFDDAERSALRLALHAGSHPNEATAEDFAACAEYFDDAQIAAIVGAISLFGYLNRWNDTMATDLESMPTAFGERVLAADGWNAGKHAD